MQHLDRHVLPIILAAPHLHTFSIPSNRESAQSKTEHEAMYGESTLGEAHLAEGAGADDLLEEKRVEGEPLVRERHVAHVCLSHSALSARHSAHHNTPHHTTTGSTGVPFGEPSLSFRRLLGRSLVLVALTLRGSA